MARLILFILIQSIWLLIQTSISVTADTSRVGDDSLVRYVNILGGTDSRYDLSHGGTLPFIGRPWGFNLYAPQTDQDDGGWWFHPYDRRFYGLRVTHQPSPWINDYGNFLIKASIPAAKNVNDPSDISGYSPSKSIFSPYYFKTTMLAYGTIDESLDMEFTGTRHGGVLRIQYPHAVHTLADTGFLQNRRVSLILNKGDDMSTVSTSIQINGENTMTISGYTKTNHGGTPDDFAHYFILALYFGPEGDKPLLDALSTHADNTWAYVDLAPEFTEVTVRFATSLISIEQAIVNLERECGAGRSFLSLVEESKLEWNDLLSRVKVEELGDKVTPQEGENYLTTFYSSLYRASLFPRQSDEVDSSGEIVHWSPYTGKVHSGHLSSDSGFWDAYSTVYPLQSLINRDRVGIMMQGWLNAYVEGGWVPKWASPGYRGSMVGTMQDVSIADAIIKKIPNFDVNLAYEAIRKDAFDVPPAGVDGVGRVCLSSYLEYGYIPEGAPMTTGGNCTEIVSRTLNYLQSDFAISQAARALGKSEDADILLARSKNFSAIFEPKTGFFRSRSILSRAFTEPFDQFAWGGDYTEAGPYQFKFYVPYDPKGLSDLYASSGRNICDELQKSQTMASTFHVGAYSSEIHEQTEMPDLCWGQYAHNNQGVHHILYMFGAVDPKGYSGTCAAKGHYWMRKVMNELYKPGADMFSGDEDNGEMSSWFVLSSLGLYSLSPGTNDMVFGSPLFGKVVIELQGTQLIVVATNNSKENVYVQKIFWNAQLLSNTNSIPYSTLMGGGTLTFEMGPNPVST